MEPSQPKPRGARAKLALWLEAHPGLVTEDAWEMLLRDLTPVSEGHLRKLLRESGRPLAPLVEGVRQETLDALELSLLGMLDEYERATGPWRLQVRKAVILAKDHAKLAARIPEKKALKEEMILWLLTWLENPPLFPAWVRLRKTRENQQ